MKKDVCILLLGGPIPEMRKRLEKSIQYVKENPDNKYYFVATGLFDELNFFSEELEKKGLKVSASILSWDTLSNLKESFFFDLWIDDAIIATGKLHGRRVHSLLKMIQIESEFYDPEEMKNPILDVEKIQILDSEEVEPIFRMKVLNILYSRFWSAKIMSKIAKGLRIK